MRIPLEDDEKAINKSLRQQVNKAKKQLKTQEEKLAKAKQWQKSELEVLHSTRKDRAFKKWQKHVKENDIVVCNAELNVLKAKDDFLTEKLIENKERIRSSAQQKRLDKQEDQLKEEITKLREEKEKKMNHCLNLERNPY